MAPRSLKWYQNRVKQLLLKPQYAQRTPEWYKARTQKITASEISACLDNIKAVSEIYVNTFKIDNYKYDGKCCSHFDTRDEFIIKKCNTARGINSYSDNKYTMWGKKYEEIACRLYRQKYNTMVFEFGLIEHDTLDYLAASPDGITPNGIMLEIKCPYSRKIGSVVPHHYYQQIQLQLEVCNLDLCHYLECEIEEVEKDEFLELSDGNYGIILDTGLPDTFIYPPDELITKDDFIKWSDLHDEKYRRIYYNIKKWQVINVERSEMWFENVKPYVKKIHNQIMNLQLNQELFDEFYKEYVSKRDEKFNSKWNQTECLLSDSV